MSDSCHYLFAHNTIPTSLSIFEALAKTEKVSALSSALSLCCICSDREKVGSLLARCLSDIFNISFSGRQTISIVFKISPRYLHM